MKNRKLGIIGTGTIGACEAVLTAGHGFETIIIGHSATGIARCRGMIASCFDELVTDGLLSEADREAALARIHITWEYEALAECELVLEAALENLAVKKEIYVKFEKACPPDVILASTTSALSADVLAAPLGHPERFVVAHPFQPAHLLPLVELVGNSKTAPEVLTRARTLLEELDREVVTLSKSVPGFIINRFAQALFRESIYLLEQGVTTPADIDKAVKYAVGMRYSSIGLLEYFDDVGFALEKSIAETVYPDLCGTQAVQERVLQGLASGETGRIAGKGLYDWSEKDEQDYLRRKTAPYKASFCWKKR